VTYLQDSWEGTCLEFGSYVKPKKTDRAGCMVGLRVHGPDNDYTCNIEVNQLRSSIKDQFKVELYRFVLPTEVTHAEIVSQTTGM